MKKKFFVLILFLSVFFISCSDVCYYNINKYEEVKKKTTYKPFSHLNDPLVFSMTVDDIYALFGIVGSKQYKKTCGEVFVIFDWEKEEVFDWVYYPTAEKGYSHGRACEHVYNGKKTYYFTRASGKELAELDPEKTEVALYPHDIYYSQTPFFSEGRYVFINSTKGNMPIHVNLYAFDTVKKEILDPFYYETYEQVDQCPITDKKGNAYVTRENKLTDTNSLNEDKTEFTADIIKVSFEGSQANTEIIKTFPLNYHFDTTSNKYVRHAFRCIGSIDKYVFITEDGYSLYIPENMMIYVYDTEKEEIVEKITVDLPLEGMIWQFVKYNEKYIGIFFKGIENGLRPLYFLELDIDGNIATEQYIAKPAKPDIEDDDSLYNWYMKGSRLYMVENGICPTKFKIYYYDFSTKTMQAEEDAIVLKLDEIVGIEN